MGKAASEELKAARGNEVDVYRWPINTIWIVFLNTQKPPFDNPDMRRAVHLALNRQELIGKALDGAGVPCAMLDPKLVGDSALPLAEVEKIPGCRAQKEQDIAEAEKLVKKHHPNGIDIEMAYRQVGNYSDRSQLVAAQLRQDRHPRHAEDARERGGLRGVRQGRLHDDHRPGPRDGRHRSRRSVLADLDHAGRQQLRQVVGSEVRRARRARAQ